MKRVTIVLTLAAAFYAGRSFAQTPQECLAASDLAADLQEKGKLVEAREQTVKCAADTCPAVVRSSCLKRQDQISTATPTIIFDVKDSRGDDVPDVSVAIDGVHSTQPISSTFSVNPGTHVFAFSAPNKTSVEKTFVIHESEKGRREAIVLTSPQPAPVDKPVVVVAAPQTAPSDVHEERPSAPPPPADTGAGSGQRAAGVALMVGAGAAAIVSGVFTGLWIGKKNDFSNLCGSPPTCPSGDQEAQGLINDEGTFSTVAIVGGVITGVALVTGIILFATAPKSSTKAAITITPTLGGLSLSGRF